MRELIDRIDLKILALLQEKANITVAATPSCPRFSRTLRWRRIQEPNVTGVIKTIDPNAIGHCSTAFFEIRCKEHFANWLGRFTQGVLAHPKVMIVRRMAGAIRYRLRVYVGRVDACDDFYRRPIESVPAKNVMSRFSIGLAKATTAYPFAGPTGV